MSLRPIVTLTSAEQDGRQHNAAAEGSHLLRLIKTSQESMTPMTSELDTGLNPHHGHVCCQWTLSKSMNPESSGSQPNSYIVSCRVEKKSCVQNCCFSGYKVKHGKSRTRRSTSTVFQAGGSVTFDSSV